MCEQVGYERVPAFGLHRRALAATRATLDAAAFVSAWEEGRALSLAEATAEALAITTTESATMADAAVDPVRALGLTPRECEILRLVVAGKSNPEIGALLFISHRTVATHLRNVYDKLEVTGRAEAIAAAIRRNLT